MENEIRHETTDFMTDPVYKSSSRKYALVAA